MTIKEPNMNDKVLHYYLIEQPNQIIEQVADYYEVDKKEIIDSKTRQKRNVADARHVCQYMIREKTSLTLKQIAKIFNRKHPSVIHALKRVNAQMENKLDNKIRNDVNKLQEVIKIN